MSYAECSNVEYITPSAVMLNNIILSIIMLNVVMLIVIWLNVPI